MIADINTNENVTTDDQIHNSCSKFMKKKKCEVGGEGQGNFYGQEMKKRHLQTRDKTVWNSSLVSRLQCMKITLS